MDTIAATDTADLAGQEGYGQALERISGLCFSAEFKDTFPKIENAEKKAAD
ncbi:hypothetical protein [Leisingera sp. S232]|uniref:hypothetical protein n=1 Tax=Leisingera sp. S232 TaxID=3415132 RepID=UPI003C7CBA25